MKLRDNHGIGMESRQISETFPDHRLHTRKMRLILAIITTLLLFALSHNRISMAVAEDASSLSHEFLFAPNKDYPYFETANQLNIDRSKAFDIETAAFLAQCSYLAYVRDTDFISATLAQADFQNTQFFDQNGSFAILAQNDNSLLLIFRGTETGDKTDYLTDAKIIQREFADHGTAHSGFISALAEIEDEISQAIQDAQEALERPIWITGHSLGGALSTLYGIKYPTKVSGIYTFGAPRIGGKRLAESAKKLNTPLFRVIHDNDMIARLPTPPFYHHIGSTYFLTSSAELVVDPASSKKRESRLSGHSEYIKRLYNEHWTKGDFNAIPSDYFADHSPRLYSDVLIGLLK